MKRANHRVRSFLRRWGVWLGIIALCLVGALGTAYGVTTPEDGDWSQKRVILKNTPEADLMVRTGDIDNLGFGWPEGFNPFTGDSTPSHGYPWTPDPSDPAGTDRIMVITSYNGNPPQGQDGYTGYTSRPENQVKRIMLSYKAALQGVTVRSAVLQMFVDDFQAPVWGASYQVQLNGKRVLVLEDVINALNQTGPIGKLITVEIPKDYLNVIATGSLSIYIDDLTTGAGDGFAIDFAKLLINPKGVAHTGTLTGIVTDSSTGLPLKDALVSTAGTAETKSGSDGTYTLNEVPAGLVVVEASRAGYISQTKSVDLAEGNTAQVDFALAPNNCTYAAYQAYTAKGGPGTIAVVTSDGQCDWTAISDVPWIVILSGGTGTGNGKVVYRVRPNAQAGSRTGTITVADKVFPILQNGKP